MTVNANISEITEGFYQVGVDGECLVVEVKNMMTGEYPDKREALMACPRSGLPRFPWKVSELIDIGCTFNKL